jgi:hypothetical protein
MASSTEPVPSGLIYRVTAVNDNPPRSLDDFTTDVTVAATLKERSVEFAGIGSTTPTGVRFHEKSADGKDVRVWMIVRDPAGVFLAEPIAEP